VKETADKQAALVMTTVARDKNPTWEPHIIIQNTKQNKLHLEPKRTDRQTDWKRDEVGLYMYIMEDKITRAGNIRDMWQGF
jgi:hypothetical protein